MKIYVFEKVNDSRIRIEIKAANFGLAKDDLSSVVINSNDWIALGIREIIKEEI